MPRLVRLLERWLHEAHRLREWVRPSTQLSRMKDSTGTAFSPFPVSASLVAFVRRAERSSSSWTSWRCVDIFVKHLPAALLTM